MIRTAVHADVPAIADLEAECLGRDAWSPWLVEQGVVGGLPTIHYVVAETGGETTGYAAASIVADIAELQRIAVTPARRRAGVAAALLAAVVVRARAGRADRLLLEVREDNEAALAFYARHGFVELDRRTRYFRDGATAIVMQLALHPAPDVPDAPASDVPDAT